MDLKAEKIRKYHTLNDAHKDLDSKKTTKRRKSSKKLNLNYKFLGGVDENDAPPRNLKCTISKPRASFRIKNLPHDPLDDGLKSTLEISRIKYRELVGFIDVMGMFCINHSPSYLYSDERPSIDFPGDINVYKIEKLEQIKAEMKFAYDTITDILLAEINKEKYRYRHQQNMVIKLLHWNKNFQEDFELYFREYYQNCFDLDIGPKNLTLKELLKSILHN
mmetsp:Transcript_39394/g.38938  ORF Transcript_39394/g.38938 Transcript_39394/m.38938 type:complete len:220 (-) Transcript_39394:12-671(-)